MEDARRCDRKPIETQGYYASSTDANWSTFDLTQRRAITIHRAGCHREWHWLPAEALMGF